MGNLLSLNSKKEKISQESIDFDYCKNWNIYISGDCGFDLNQILSSSIGFSEFITIYWKENNTKNKFFFFTFLEKAIRRNKWYERPRFHNMVIIAIDSHKFEPKLLKNQISEMQEEIGEIKKADIPIIAVDINNKSISTGRIKYLEFLSELDYDNVGFFQFFQNKNNEIDLFYSFIYKIFVSEKSELSEKFKINIKEQLKFSYKLSRKVRSDCSLLSLSIFTKKFHMPRRLSLEILKLSDLPYNIDSIQELKFLENNKWMKLNEIYKEEVKEFKF